MNLDSQGTRTLEALKVLGHWQDTWYLGTQGIWALWHSRHLGTWPLGHYGTQALKRYLGTLALKHLDTWALEAVEGLYLAYSHQ